MCVCARLLLAGAFGVTGGGEGKDIWLKLRLVSDGVAISEKLGKKLKETAYFLELLPTEFHTKGQLE